jgi:SAM-dependent methyltransferase
MKMLNYAVDYILQLESDHSLQGRDELMARLSKLGLDDFGEFLLSLPNSDFPRLSGILPRMASDQVQRDWTGNAGIPLLKQTLNFVRSLSYNYNRLTGRPLDEAKILDYGCGYGRIARLMYAFVGEDSFYGLDPWDRSIEICRADGLTKNFLQSEYLPDSLPVGAAKFDLIYAFSVFTHLSERATLAALGAMRKCISPDGILAITIRPEEYWQHDVHTSPAMKTELSTAHRDKGFAFCPHKRAAVDGDVTYGDTSMTLDWLDSHATGWVIRGTDRSLEDPLQRYVFLSIR